MQVRYVRGSQIAGAVQDLQGMATAAAAADELAAHRARLAAELQDKARQSNPVQTLSVPFQVQDELAAHRARLAAELQDKARRKEKWQPSCQWTLAVACAHMCLCWRVGLSSAPACWLACGARFASQQKRMLLNIS